jgi:hypothetical protein
MLAKRARVKVEYEKRIIHKIKARQNSIYLKMNLTHTLKVALLLLQQLDLRSGNMTERNNLNTVILIWKNRCNSL